MATFQVAEGHRVAGDDGRIHEFPAKIELSDEAAEALVERGHVTKPGRQQQADDPNTGEGTDGQGGSTDQQSDGSRRRVQRN